MKIFGGRFTQGPRYVPAIKTAEEQAASLGKQLTAAITRYGAGSSEVETLIGRVQEATVAAKKRKRAEDDEALRVKGGGRQSQTPSSTAGKSGPLGL
jgi:hypothetical protein